MAAILAAPVAVEYKPRRWLKNSSFQGQPQIAPIPERLASLGVTLQDVVTALDRNNGNVGAGYIERRGEQYLIRAPGQVKSLEDIGNVILSSANGVPVRVRDVAEVGIGRELRTGAATDNGREVVLGTVFMLIGENSRTVSQAVDKKMLEVNKSLPEGVHAVTVCRRTPHAHSRPWRWPTFSLPEGDCRDRCARKGGNRASRPCERPKWAAQEATKSKKWRLPRSRGKFRGLVQRSLKQRD